MSDENALKLVGAIQAGQLNGVTPSDCGRFAPILTEAVAALETNGKEAAMRLIAGHTELSNLAAGGLEPVPAFKRLSAADLMNEPDAKWLFKGLLQERSLAMLFGEPGAGKTFVTLDLLFCAANGVTFAGQFEATKKMDVLYCTDEGVAGLKQRQAALANKFQVRPGDVGISYVKAVPGLFDPDPTHGVEQFIKEQQAYGPLDLVVVDTLHAASAGAEENSAKDTREVIKNTKRIRDELNCAVVLVHHANKQGGYRGSSAFHGAMDAMLLCESHPKDVFCTFRAFKEKDAGKFMPISYRIKPDLHSESAFIEWVGPELVQVETVPKKTQAKAEIERILIDTPGIGTNEIIKKLVGLCGKETAQKALGEMETEGRVTYENGPNKAKLYRLQQVVGR